MVSIFPKITLILFEVNNFSWKTDKLNFKNFVEKKRFEIILKKSRVWALKLDKNSRIFFGRFPSLKMAKLGGKIFFAVCVLIMVENVKKCLSQLKIPQNCLHDPFSDVWQKRRGNVFLKDIVKKISALRATKNKRVPLVNRDVIFKLIFDVFKILKILQNVFLLGSPRTLNAFLYLNSFIKPVPWGSIKTTESQLGFLHDYLLFCTTLCRQKRKSTQVVFRKFLSTPSVLFLPFFDLWGLKTGNIFTFEVKNIFETSKKMFLYIIHKTYKRWQNFTLKNRI